jgi:hypothetical protein
MRFTMPHLLKPSDILAMAKIPADQDRAEVRIYAGAVTFIFMLMCLSPAAFILLDPASDISRTTRVTALPGALIAAAFVCAALLALPHAVTLVGLPHYLTKRGPRLCAIWGAILAGFTWLYLGVTVEPLDFGDPPWSYWVKAIGAALIAGVYAYSLNNQTLRENDRPARID